ncbi:hypothetical protein JCM10914A_45290 [Paenibacillus sp. JCM 10914]
MYSPLSIDGKRYIQVRKDLIEIFKRLCKYKGVEILEGHMMRDHAGSDTTEDSRIHIHGISEREKLANDF